MTWHFRRTPIAALAIGLLLTAANARAQTSNAPSADQLIARAQAAETDLEYDDAADVWMAVIARDDLTDAQRLEANLNAGRIARIRGQDMEARMHFGYVLKRRPDYKLPAGTSPKVANFFELVRQELSSSDEGRPLSAPQAPTPPATAAVAAPATSRPALVAAPAPAAPERGFPWLLASGLGGAGVGLLTVGVGVFAGVNAWGLDQRAVKDDVQLSRAAGYDDRDQAALIANLCYGAGGVLLVAGASAAVVSVLVVHE